MTSEVGRAYQRRSSARGVWPLSLASSVNFRSPRFHSLGTHRSIDLRWLDGGECQRWQLSPSNRRLGGRFTSPAKRLLAFPTTKNHIKFGPHAQPHPDLSSPQGLCTIIKSQIGSLSVCPSSYMTNPGHESSICLTSTPTIFLLSLPSQPVVSQKVM